MRSKALDKSLSMVPFVPLNPIAHRRQLVETYAIMGWQAASLASFDSFVLSWISAYLTGELGSCLYDELRVKKGLN